MDVAAGIKRKPQAVQTVSRKKQATESLDGDVNEMEDDSASSVDMNEEHGTSDWSEEEEEEELSDEDDEVYDDEEFPWLKSIDIQINADDAADSPRVGFCTAKLIDRDNIRATFHRDMDEPSNDTATVGVGVFNRWGCLKPEFLHSPVKKGTGVWGPELNEGRFLLIETISIQEEYQRKGYGKKAFEQVWEKAQDLAVQEGKDRAAVRKQKLEKLWEDIYTEVEKATETSDNCLDRRDKIITPDQPGLSGCDFAIVWAAVMNVRDVEAEAKLSSTERELLYEGKQYAVEEFWRAMGFRRIGSSSFFCLAKDPNHASHSLLSQDDYKRPAVLAASARADDQDFPHMDSENDPNAREQKEYNDAETKELLEARLQSHPTPDVTWLSVDRHGNNILHILARDYKAESLQWLLALPFADNLLSVRNLEGETPLEALETRLESERTFKEVAFAGVDCFSGFSSIQVECLKQLKRVKVPSPIEISRLTFGCTCGLCLGGFLSPRVTFALKCQGEACHDILNDELVNTTSGNDWCEDWEHMFHHLPPSAKSNLRTNKSMRQGFTNVLLYIAQTLEARLVPTSHNVLDVQLAGSNERPPYTRNYLQRGGTVDAVLQACFDCVIDHDQYLGDGAHHVTSQSDIDLLPACRNDGEFVVARQECRRLERLPEKVALLGARIR